jgi:hypothetical protein
VLGHQISGAPEDGHCHSSSTAQALHHREIGVASTYDPDFSTVSFSCSSKRSGHNLALERFGILIY